METDINHPDEEDSRHDIFRDQIYCLPLESIEPCSYNALSEGISTENSERPLTPMLTEVCSSLKNCSNNDLLKNDTDASSERTEEVIENSSCAIQSENEAKDLKSIEPSCSYNAPSEGTFTKNSSRPSTPMLTKCSNTDLLNNDNVASIARTEGVIENSSCAIQSETTGIGYFRHHFTPVSSPSSSSEDGVPEELNILSLNESSIPSDQSSSGDDSSSSSCMLVTPEDFSDRLIWDSLGSSDDSDNDGSRIPDSIVYDINSFSDTHDSISDNGEQLPGEEVAATVNDVLKKPKPTYTWHSTHELIHREHGIAGNGRYSLQNGFSPGFNSRFYASRQVVERMKLMHCLLKHSGCVNSLNFNRTGTLLCTGSDDTNICVWDWAQNMVKYSYRSGHTQNIFQTKFIESMSYGSLDIVSAGRDGEVRRAIIPSAGGNATTYSLYKHKGPVHKIVVCPQSPTDIISVGEDGCIKHQDLRKEGESTLKSVKTSTKIPLFSISHHPFSPEICVCGDDRFVRVFDKRNMTKSVHEMCPKKLLEKSLLQITCSVYNSTGSEILSSYSDDHIYLFNNKSYNKGDYLHCYKGHNNHKTIKGVNFFGPNSEYVISGSDCSNIFFWDKNTEAILNCMPGDTFGVVNCLEPHPFIPVLATSGLDNNIKIWAPNNDYYPPDLSKLETCVKRNLRRYLNEETNSIENRQVDNLIRHYLRQPRSGNVPALNTSSSEDELTQDFDCRTQ